MQCYGRDWSPVCPGLKDFGSWIQVPESGATLVAFAEAISSRLCCPFVRIDLYDTSRGVFLGEFTPSIGGRHTFNDVWNERMLTRWFEAVVALEWGLRSGRVRPPMREEPEAAPPSASPEAS